jgi:hypothetical protein
MPRLSGMTAARQPLDRPRRMQARNVSVRTRLPHKLDPAHKVPRSLRFFEVLWGTGGVKA